MSDNHAHAHAADDHDHGHGPDDGEHHPHVLDLKYYFGVWGLLLVLTGITVGVSYIDLGPLNLPIALLVATIKASAVAAIFMHLFFDHKFHAIIFSLSVIFLAVFIVFTMFDTETRGKADPAEAGKPVDVTQPFNGTVADQALKEAFERIDQERQEAKAAKEAKEHGKPEPKKVEPKKVEATAPAAAPEVLQPPH
jgi:cytochrome c oxidase subunit 4